MHRQLLTSALAALLSLGCEESSPQPTPERRAEVMTLQHQGVRVQAVVDRPVGTTSADVVLLYHGTVFTDDRILEAAWNILAQTQRITQRRDLIFISVAYPEEGLLMGDNLSHAEAALLWTRNTASTALGVRINKVFLLGHSQGGYLVTRLNRLHTTDGVIANGPGPLDLVFRCNLEAAGSAPTTPTCQLLAGAYGQSQANPAPYADRSLLAFTDGFLAPMLLVQGLNDGSVQMASWPTFRQRVAACTNCASRQVLEVPGYGHEALFNSPVAIEAYNQMIGR